MTEERAIEKCQEMIKRNNKIVKEARKVGDTNTIQLVAELDIESLAMQTVLNMLKEKDKEIEHQIEKRNNQKSELAILNEKQKEMNKLINTLSSYRGMFKKLQAENNKQKEELEMYKDFKEIANTDIGYINPIKVLEVKNMLDRQCKRQQIILNKVAEECRKQMTIYEDSIMEIFPQKLLNIIEGEKK